MAYSKEIYEKAHEIIKKRKHDAEFTASQHKSELIAKHSELADIEAELNNTGFEIISCFALPESDLQKKLEEICKKNTALREAQRAILVALGYPEDYFKVKYICEKCEDTGFIEERDDEKGVSYGSRLCKCHTELLKKLATENMAKSTPLELSTFEDFDIRYYSREKVNGESPYEVMSFVLNSCKEYAENFDMDSNNLYFYGRTGLGKTHLSLAIANEVIKKGYSVVYGSVIGFLNKMEREKFGKGEAFETENILIDADLLILDDLGAEFQTSFTVSAIYNIINSRIARSTPTIISSNLDFEELKARYPESITSRILGKFSIVNFIGKDIRQIKNNED